MSQYREILRISGLTPLIVSQLVARAPGGMLTITLIMHAEHIFGSYALAGLVIAATSVGAAIAGPVTSRWMSTWGMRQVLLLTIAIYSATLLLMALVVTPFPVYALGGLLLGAANPPIQSAVRTIYPKLATARQLPAVFSLDASLQEIIWAGQAFLKGTQGISGAIWPLFFTGIYYLIFSGLLTLALGKLEKKLDYFKA